MARLNYLFAILKMTVIPSLACIVLTEGQQSEFTRLSDTHIDHGYKSFTTSSVLACCSECQSDTLCESVSFQIHGKSCQLNDRNPDISPDVTTVTSADWVSYSVPSPIQRFQYNQHYYFAVPEPMTWKDAESNCQTLGGHLLSIDDAAENTFVFDQLSEIYGPPTPLFYWFGLNAINTGAFVYSSGELVMYFNWAQGEPSSSLEKCANVLHNQMWNDSGCHGLLKSVCETNID